MGDHGYHFKVKFLRDGTFTESKLFADSATRYGTWHLSETSFKMNIDNYELEALANREGSIHSGIELDKSSNLPSAYFKLIHLL